MTDLLIREGAICGAVLNGSETLETDTVILAIGHSARDTFRLLRDLHIPMEQKPFSLGARIEHLQEKVDRSQYGKFAGHPALGAADYRLAVHLPNGRGVYTFCMCPGGQVITYSEESRLVTNGMSSRARDGVNANSALLVGISPVNFGSENMSQVELERRIEEAAFLAGGGGYKAPAQRVGDFLQKSACIPPGRCETYLQARRYAKRHGGFSFRNSSRSLCAWGSACWIRS